MTSHELWKLQADYDLETARAMLEGGRYFYVLFCSQQAVEKLLKSLWSGRKQELPPRTHNLILLAEQLGIVLSGIQKNFLRIMSNYYIQSRYPDTYDPAIPNINEHDATEIYQQTKDFISWLSTYKF